MKMAEKQLVFVAVTIFGIIAATLGATTVIQEGIYVLETSSDGENLTVTATVQTTGYVGFGISPGGNMTGADLVITGVNSTSGESYIGDYHGTGNTLPTSDTVQNVWLISASENATHTTVEFQRPLSNAADQNEDLAVENRTQFIIWSIGANDSILYHGAELRGTIELNLLQD